MFISIRYSKEQLENAKEIISLTFSKEGFKEMRTKITKVTEKKVYFEDELGTFGKETFQTNVGGNLESFNFIHNERNCLVTRKILLLEKDLEEVKALIQVNAKKQIQKSIDSLKTQLIHLNS